MRTDQHVHGTGPAWHLSRWNRPVQMNPGSYEALACPWGQCIGSNQVDGAAGGPLSDLYQEVKVEALGVKCAEVPDVWAVAGDRDRVGSLPGEWVHAVVHQGRPGVVALLPSSGQLLAADHRLSRSRQPTLGPDDATDDSGREIKGSPVVRDVVDGWLIRSAAMDAQRRVVDPEDVDIAKNCGPQPRAEQS